MELPIDYTRSTPDVRRRAREQYVLEQKGQCHHCKQPLSGPPLDTVKALRINLSLFPPNFLRWPVHLHHCHKTGMTIGAVHSYCNAVLWQHHGE